MTSDSRLSARRRKLGGIRACPLIEFQNLDEGFAVDLISQNEFRSGDLFEAMLNTSFRKLLKAEWKRRRSNHACPTIEAAKIISN